MHKGPVANCKCSIGYEQKIKADSDAKVHESLLYCNIRHAHKCNVFNLIPIKRFNTYIFQRDIYKPIVFFKIFGSKNKIGNINSGKMRSDLKKSSSESYVCNE